MISPMEFLDEEYKFITRDMVPDVEENRYLVSNYGTVIDTKNNREISQTPCSNGYLEVSLKTSTGRKRILLHRLVGIAFIDGDRSLQINHKDGRKNNEYYKNLEWATSRENLIHALDMGLNHRCENKPNSILTNDQVERICYYLSNGYDYSTIISLMNLPNTKSINSILHDIKCKKSWTSISDKYDLPTHKIVNNRLLTNDQVLTICNMLERNRYVSNDELFESAGIDVSTPDKRNKMRHCIESIKSRKAYMDISKKFNW